MEFDTWFLGWLYTASEELLDYREALLFCLSLDYLLMSFAWYYGF
jgi:hypothetical protein